MKIAIETGKTENLSSNLLLISFRGVGWGDEIKLDLVTGFRSEVRKFYEIYVVLSF